MTELLSPPPSSTAPFGSAGFPEAAVGVPALDLPFARSRFPALSRGEIFLDNAGGSLVLAEVADRVRDYLLSTSVQLGATYRASAEAAERVEAATRAAAALVGAEPGEVVLGSSSTALLQMLARALAESLGPGDEIVVTNTDHEANITPWARLAERGVHVRFWNVHAESLALDLAELDALLGEKTRLVCFTQVSNILGTINPVEEITRRAHAAGARVVVDGVAFAPHRAVDVKSWDVDYYVFSLYKVFGPHQGLLYGRRALLLELANQNHVFVAKDAIPYKLLPGNLNYELSAAVPAIVEYLEELGRRAGGPGAGGTRGLLGRAFAAIARHEEDLVAPLLDFLARRPGVRLLGLPTADREQRVATVSFAVDGRKSSEIPAALDPHGIGIRYGDFHARRLIEALGLTDRQGVVRISMAHYNTPEEIGRLLERLDGVL
jgi:cysteine desulfurase family protein (TIGR01976 family)